MGTRLKGMTWSHSRGYDPMVACSAEWRKKTGTEITWDRRSLQDFESFPVAELAAAYDFIVIDHPHVGQITQQHCLLPLDDAAHAVEREPTVGRSYPSYNWQGRQWAYPIDAATQVQAYRPDRHSGPVSDLEDVLRLAGKGRVLLPLRPPHSLMCFFTLAAHLGTPCKVDGPELIALADGREVLDWLQRLARTQPEEAYGMDPIAVLDAMGEAGGEWDLSPLIYGYVSYSHQGFRPARIAFADMPVIGGRAPAGSALGGTGIAVSASTLAPDEAKAFARWIAGAGVQTGLYTSSGGQPGHPAAWEDDAVNARALDFYRATRATLDGAWLRPRHDGYMGFQEKAARLLTSGLRDGAAHGTLVDTLNGLFAQSCGKVS